MTIIGLQKSKFKYLIQIKPKHGNSKTRYESLANKKSNSNISIVDVQFVKTSSMGIQKSTLKNQIQQLYSKHQRNLCEWYRLYKREALAYEPQSLPPEFGYLVWKIWLCRFKGDTHTKDTKTIENLQLPRVACRKLGAFVWKALKKKSISATPDASHPTMHSGMNWAEVTFETMVKKSNSRNKLKQGHLHNQPLSSLSQWVLGYISSILSISFVRGHAKELTWSWNIRYSCSVKCVLGNWKWLNSTSHYQESFTSTFFAYSHIHLFPICKKKKPQNCEIGIETNQFVLSPLMKEVRNKVCWHSFDWNLGVLHMRSKRLSTNVVSNLFFLKQSRRMWTSQRHTQADNSWRWLVGLIWGFVTWIEFVSAFVIVKRCQKWHCWKMCSTTKNHKAFFWNQICTLNFN